jgi:hypothetical protein
MSIKYLIVILFFVVNSTNVFSQNTFGSINSNYSPSNSVSLNPSSISNSKTFLDINLIGAGIYANNNLLMIPNSNFFNILTTGTTIDRKKDVFFDQNTLNQKETINLFSKTFIAGPGFIITQGDHSGGLSFNNRGYAAINNIPYFIGSFAQHGLVGFPRQQGKDFEAKDMRFAAFNFSEIKASYSKTFYKKDKNILAAGISIKKFYSLAGAAANINDLSFNVHNDTALSVYKFDADRMTTSGGLYRKGGMGLDLGITYQKMLVNSGGYLPHMVKSGCRYIPYKYKVGFSIIDIGSVKFDQSKETYNGYNYKDIEINGYSNITTNPDSVASIFSSQDDLKSGLVKKTNKIMLPTFISAQVDYNIWASAVYVNAMIIQGISHSSSKFGIRHASSISITPRFETRLVDFALPFSLYEYSKAQLGMSFRVGPLTIGSDKFINWIINSDLYGGDIYVYFKAPLIYHPKCREMVLNRKRKQSDWKSKINCAF